MRKLLFSAVISIACCGYATAAAQDAENAPAIQPKEPQGELRATIRPRDVESRLEEFLRSGNYDGVKDAELSIALATQQFEAFDYDAARATAREAMLRVEARGGGDLAYAKLAAVRADIERVLGNFERELDLRRIALNRTERVHGEGHPQTESLRIIIARASIEHAARNVGDDLRTLENPFPGLGATSVENGIGGNAPLTRARFTNGAVLRGDANNYIRTAYRNLRQVQGPDHALTRFAGAVEANLNASTGRAGRAWDRYEELIGAPGAARYRDRLDLMIERARLASLREQSQIKEVSKIETQLQGVALDRPIAFLLEDFDIDDLVNDDRVSGLPARFEEGYADVSFCVRPDGGVEQVEIAASNDLGDLALRLITAFESRRYLPWRADDAADCLPQLERFEVAASESTDRRPTRIKRKDTDGTVVFTDLFGGARLGQGIKLPSSTNDADAPGGS